MSTDRPGDAAPAVDVLMATYNGAAHVAEQVRSVQAQDFAGWRLLVRDDGSQDDTIAIVDALAAEDPRIVRLADGRGNLGFTGNFRALLAASDCPYAAFCDQDDVWLPAKLSASLALMRRLEAARPGRPVLVHCDAAVVDAALAVTTPRFIGPRGRRRGLPGVIFHNSVQGAATLVNAALRERLLGQDADLPFDHHAALVAELAGARGYVDEALLLYRQHGGNAVGVATGAAPPAAGAPASLPYNLRLALDGVEPIEAVIAANRAEASPAARRHVARWRQVMRGRSRLARSWWLLVERYATMGRLDRWRLLAAIWRGRA